MYGEYPKYIFEHMPGKPMTPEYLKDFETDERTEEISRQLVFEQIMEEVLDDPWLWHIAGVAAEQGILIWGIEISELNKACGNYSVLDGEMPTIRKEGKEVWIRVKFEREKGRWIVRVESKAELDKGFMRRSGFTFDWNTKEWVQPYPFEGCIAKSGIKAFEKAIDIKKKLEEVLK